MAHDVNATLNICMLGDFRVTLNGNLLPQFPTRESELLFAYLLLHRDRFFHRDALIENFFKDQPITTARKRLRNDIWRIRSVLEPQDVTAGSFLTVTNREIGFNTDSRYRLDTEDLEQIISKIALTKTMPMKAEDYLKLKEALKLYRGDFLEGIYEEWCVWEKERLKMLCLRGLETMMNHHAAKSELHRAISFGEQLIAHDPLREHIHRSLIRFYYLVGDRPTAVLRYSELTALLSEELNIEPMQATTELYSAIKDETLSVPPHSKALEKDHATQKSEMQLVQECLGDINSLANQLSNLNSKLRNRIQVNDNELDATRFANI